MNKQVECLTCRHGIQSINYCNKHNTPLKKIRYRFAMPCIDYKEWKGFVGACK